MRMKKDIKILVIKMSSLGDIVHSLPFLHMLRSTYPSAHITWAVHDAYIDILPGKPWIDELYVVHRRQMTDLSYLMKIRKELKKYEFDLVIDLQMLAKSAIISFLSGGKLKIGRNKNTEFSKFFSKPINGRNNNGHVIEQLLDVARFLGGKDEELKFPLPNFKSQEKMIKLNLEENGIYGKYVLVVPGTRGMNKMWPIENWRILVKKLVESKIPVVITGMPSEKKMIEKISDNFKCNEVLNIVGKTGLLDLLALENLAKVHVSVDTGPLHIANALKKPLVALFGPTFAKRSGPYGNPNSVVLIAKNEGKRKADMRDINVDRVYKEVIKFCMRG